MVEDQKVLVIGLDGGMLDLIESLVDKGLMPRMGNLLREGVSGTLESVFPAITAPAWASFMTGTNPGKHGIFNFFKNLRELNNRQIISHDSIKAPTLMAAANESGKKVISINMPVTYPPPPVDGCVISGMFTPSLSAQFTHPADLYNELKDKLGEYVVAVPFQRYDENHMDIFLRDIMHCLRQRAKYGLELIRRFDWDLFMVVFTSTDYFQHAMWNNLTGNDESAFPRADDKSLERILDFYRELDASIERLLETIDDNTQVFIVSDHGFGPLEKKFYVNTWLSELGLLHFSGDFASALRRFAVPKINKAKRAVAKLDRYDLRSKLKRGARTFAFDKVFDMIDWSKTKAFAGSYSEQGIYINTKDSWPHGIVSRGEEYDDIRNSVFAELARLKDPRTGAAIKVECYKREDIYSGRCVDQAPDLVFALEDGACIIDNSPSNKLFDYDVVRMHGQGTHRSEGILVAWGNGIRKGQRIEGARIIDMAPTILYSLGARIPYDVDGSILRKIFEPDFSSARAELYQEEQSATTMEEEEAYSEEDARAIEERLRGLGYL
jgi:predicted AlkP superfamily phosphohydrolase/phosphomutase